MRIIEQLVYKIQGDNSEFDRSIDKSETKVSKFGSVADKIFAGVTVAAIGMAVKKMGEMVISSATALDRVDKLSQKIGISRVAFQEWDYILGQSGASVEGLQMGVKTLSNAADEARKGTALYAEAFDRLGVSVTDANGNMKDQETLFAEVFSALADMENQTERTAIATKLLGRSATELAPTLNTSKEGIEQLRSEAHSLGLVYSDELVDAGVVLGDNIDRLKKSFEALKTNALAPIIGLAVTFTDKLLGQNTGTKNLDDATRSLVTQSKAYKDILTQLKDPTVVLTDAERARLEILKGIQAQNLEDTIYQTNRAYKDGIADVRKAEQTLADLEATQAAYTLVTKDQSEAIKRRDELSRTKNRTDAETLELSKLNIALMATEFQRQTELLSIGDRIGEQKKKANALNGATAESVRAVAMAVEAETLSISQYALTSPDFYSAVMAQVDAIKEEKQATLDATEAFKEYSTWSDVMIAGKIAELEMGERSLAGEKLLQMLYQKRNEILAVSAQKSAELSEKEQARIDILNNTNSAIASAEQYALALGDSYDLNAQKASILETTIKALIDSGLTAEDSAVANLITQLQALKTTTEEVTNTSVESFNAEAKARSDAYAEIEKSRMSDKDKAFKAIQEQADAYLKSGVSIADVAKWQSEQIQKYQDEQTRIVQKEADKQKAIEEEKTRVEQEELEKRNQAILEAFNQSTKTRADAYKLLESYSLSEKDKAIANIQAQADKFLEAGVSIVDVATWQSNELDKLAKQNEKSWNDALESIAENGFKSFISGFEDIGKAIGEGADVWKAFQAMGLNAIASIVEALGHELAARAIVSLLAGDFVGFGLATAGSISAYTAAGLLKSQIPSYDVGSIRIPETTTATVHKDEMILTAPQAEQARREGITIAPTKNGGNSVNLVIYLDGKEIARNTIDNLNSGSVGTIKARVVK